MTAAVALFAALDDADDAPLLARVCTAVVRNVLGRGRRLLVHADSALLWPVLMAAGGFRPAPGLERNAPPPPPPLVVVPLDDDSLESALFAPVESGDDERARAPSWFAALAPPDLADHRSGSDALVVALPEVEPELIVAVGGNERLQSSLAVAAGYAQGRSVRLLAVGSPVAAAHGWPDVESVVRRNLEPRAGDERSEGTDVELRAVAAQARREAFLVLATTVVVDGEEDMPRARAR